MSIRVSVRPYVRLSAKRYLDFNEIWLVARQMNCSMQYYLIQGQGHTHKPFKVGNPSIFKSYVLRHLQ